MLHFTINFMAILCSASDLAIGGHLDFLFLYPIEVRPIDRGRTGHRLWLGFRLRLGVEMRPVASWQTRPCSVKDQAE